MRITRSTIGIAAGLILGLASSGFAQLTVWTPEQKHDRMSLTTRGHAETHSKVMWEMQARMDTTLLRSHALAQRLTEHLQKMPEAATKQQAVASRMTQNLILLTDALHSLADELGTLMADEGTVRDRAMQTHMEDIQMRLGDMASESQKILKALEKMAGH